MLPCSNRAPMAWSSICISSSNEPGVGTSTSPDHQNPASTAQSESWSICSLHSCGACANKGYILLCELLLQCSIRTAHGIAVIPSTGVEGVPLESFNTGYSGEMGDSLNRYTGLLQRIYPALAVPDTLGHITYQTILPLGACHDGCAEVKPCRLYTFRELLPDT